MLKMVDVLFKKTLKAHCIFPKSQNYFTVSY